VGDAATYDNEQGIRLVTATNRRNPPQCVDSKIHHCNLINNSKRIVLSSSIGDDESIIALLCCCSSIAEDSSQHLRRCRCTHAGLRRLRIWY